MSEDEKALLVVRAVVGPEELVQRERDLALRIRAQEESERDIAGYPERARAQRHHDVLCLVLKAYIEKWRETLAELPPDARGTLSSIIDEEALVSIARKFADLAYPPPKAEPKPAPRKPLGPYDDDPNPGPEPY